MTKLISILPPSENHTIGESKSVWNEVRIDFTLPSKRFAIKYVSRVPILISIILF